MNGSLSMATGTNKEQIYCRLIAASNEKSVRQGGNKLQGFHRNEALVAAQGADTKDQFLRSAGGLR